ncbi:SMP-30/gluconolactonase/LRE family protein [Paralcaligenes sp. KSB-10]|uniref:SMP-30/gluconolactonase/LRE family protein n=1 Tax=Paralcaligenes sp. KSB-10 TaxID=2901142 RepID=UPI001E31BB99|nr:SMP-30/gluconolactonase/LRE family protein [Paralcaligenes sp. KSB-10]UHL66366.1 SMP-30/gluconolactonase/LRE family protein [Paralcaligenes sp. KSB-10]
MSAAIIFDDAARGVFRPDSRLKQVATGAAWSEGPVWIHEARSLLWSDIPNNRILCWREGEDEGFSVWREGVDFTNGHYRDLDGSILHCSHGRRAIIRTRMIDGLARTEDEVVVDRYQGRRLNSPNDIVVKSDGTIWFSDPPYGILSDREGHKAPSELRHNYVFRFDPRTSALDIATDYLDEPNGLAFSPDESVLYVSDTSAALRPEGQGRHHIISFKVGAGGTLSDPKTFAEVNPGLPDGFRLDERGWIYTSSASGVQIYHSDGRRLAEIPVPEKVGNLTFGGLGGDSLFICATTSLYRIHLNAKGLQK